MKLPTDISGQEMIGVLLRAGFGINRQKGSHIVLRRDDPYAASTRKSPPDPALQRARPDPP